MKSFAICLLAVLVLQPAGWANERNVEDEILMRLEMLDEEELPTVNNSEIASVSLLTDIYSQLRLKPAWSDAARVKQWIGVIENASDDGFDVNDFHYGAIQNIRTELLSQKLITPARRAEIDLISTDSLIRLAYSSVFGKINPY